MNKEILELNGSCETYKTEKLKSETDTVLMSAAVTESFTETFHFRGIYVYGILV